MVKLSPEMVTWRLGSPKKRRGLRKGPKNFGGDICFSFRGVAGFNFGKQKTNRNQSAVGEISVLLGAVVASFFHF